MKYKTAVKKKTQKKVKAAGPSPLPDILAGSLIVFLPLVFSLTGYDKFRLPKDLVWVLGIVAVATALLVTQRIQLRFRLGTWESGLLASLIFLFVHTLIFARDTLGFRGLISYALFLVLFFCLKEVVSPRFLKWVWLGLGTTLAISSVLTVLQFFGLVPLVVDDSTGDVIMGRINPAGFIGEVNSGGFLFALASIYLVFYIVTEEKQGLKVLASILFFTNLVGLAFARTLTAVTGLLVCFLLWLVFHHWWVLRKGIRVSRPLVLLWIALALGGIGAAGLGYQSGVLDRISLVVSQMRDGNWLFATAGRQPVYLLTWEMIKQRPISGHGLNSFGRDFFYFRSDTEIGREANLLSQSGSYRQVHNEYLQIWNELGVVGLLLFLVLYIGLIVSSLRSLFREEDTVRSYWLGISIIGLTFIAVSCLAFFPFHLSLTVTAVTLVFAGIRSSNSQGEGERPSYASARPRSLAMVLAIVFVLLIGYVQTRRWQANSEVGVAAYLLERATSGSPEFSQAQVRAFADEALARLERGETWLYGTFDIFNLKGSALMVLGRYDDAAENFQLASQYVPSSEVLTNLAAAHLARDRLDEAERCIELALAYDKAFGKAREARDYLRSVREQ